MDLPDWTAAGNLFAQARELSADARDRFLEERCDGRPELLAAVLRLLAADRAADSGFLRLSEPEMPPEPSEARVPARVGPYRLIAEIGAGGMGRVFLAQRADGQFQQQVAVKLLKRGMDSEAVLARFLRERQILAGLDHPHIARLLDGGIAEDGRPFFVMEVVNGQPITRYCDQHRLTIDQRLTLVRTVCLAVEYAHRNLVVHRDLKPSNILVTAEGVPKLLDFGIAKLLATEEGDTPATTLTLAGGRLLTPEYAAPEQFRGGPITTSTDVYSMGAVLYELLSGERPFPDRSVAQDRLAGLEQDPPALSSRVSDPERRRQLAGDLDVIVAKALRAVPERRYPSMEGLREDLRRHQERLPVRARPDTLRYRTSRFIRRHRTAVASAAAIALLVLLFGIVATVQAIRIRRQSEELAAERDRARREATAAQEVSDFLVGVFQVSDPEVQGLGDSLTARELLDRGAARIEAGLAGQPELQARLLGIIGQAYTNLLDPERAEPLLLRGAGLWRSVGPRGQEGLVASLQQLADARTQRGDYSGAEQALREALALPPPGGSPGSRWTLYVDLATVFHAHGAIDRARASADTALRWYRGNSAPALPTDRADLGRLALLLTYTRHREEMETVYARLVQLEAAELGPRSASMALLYNRWAGARIALGHREAGDSLHRLALSIHQELAPRSVATARTMGLLANNALGLGDLERAESLLRGALAIYGEELTEDHPTVLATNMSLADILRRQGRHEESVPLLRLTVATYRRAGGGQPTLPGAEWRLGVALRDAGQPAASLAPFRSALSYFEQRYPADFLTTAQLRRDYGSALVAARRFREAEPVLRRAVDVLTARYGDRDPRVESTRIHLGRTLGALGRRNEADTLLLGVETRMTAALGPADTLVKQARAAREALNPRH